MLRPATKVIPPGSRGCRKGLESRTASNERRRVPVAAQFEAQTLHQMHNAAVYMQASDRQFRTVPSCNEQKYSKSTENTRSAAGAKSTGNSKRGEIDEVLRASWRAALMDHGTRPPRSRVFAGHFKRVASRSVRSSGTQSLKNSPSVAFLDSLDSLLRHTLLLHPNSIARPGQVYPSASTRHGRFLTLQS